MAANVLWYQHWKLSSFCFHFVVHTHFKCLLRGETISCSELISARQRIYRHVRNSPPLEHILSQYPKYHDGEYILRHRHKPAMLLAHRERCALFETLVCYVSSSLSTVSGAIILLVYKLTYDKPTQTTRYQFSSPMILSDGNAFTSIQNKQQKQNVRLRFSLLRVCLLLLFM